jgi:hypothetical protein
MASAPLSSLLLHDFLDVLPKSALIIRSRPSGDSLTVCYANQTFLDIVGHDSADSDLGTGIDVSNSLTSMLRTKCVRPTMSRFIKWIDTVLQNSSGGHGLRTSFEVNENVGEGPPTAHRKIVDIKWKARVLKSTYVILTGKVTGTASYFTGGASTRPTRPSLLRMRSDTSHNSNESNESPSVIRAISPILPSSPIDIHPPGSGFTTSYFTEAFTEDKAGSPKGLDPWRHTEKVSCQSGISRDDCRF